MTLVKYHYLHNLLCKRLSHSSCLPAGWCWCLLSLWLGIMQELAQGDMVRRFRYCAGGDGSLLHGRLRRDGLLPFIGRSAELPDTG
ncbi:MAG: hypothetical protein MZV63_53555 [Marinilabiliales bacterium]|nr:hypothetical protein [Marinilabiliales bacterium]